MPGSRTFRRSFALLLALIPEVAAELARIRFRRDGCGLNYIWMLEPVSRKPFRRRVEPLRRRVKPFAVAMEEGRGVRGGPCANPGCKDPDNPSGQWTWLPLATELAGLDLREGAACRCNKRAARGSSGRGQTRKLPPPPRPGAASARAGGAPRLAQGGGQTGGLADAKRRGHEGARGGARAAGWDARVGRKATRVGARTW